MVIAPRRGGPGRDRTGDPLVAKHSDDSGEKRTDAPDRATPRTDETLRQETSEAPRTGETPSAPKSTANVTLMAPGSEKDLARIAQAWAGLPKEARQSILVILDAFTAPRNAKEPRQ